MSIYQNKIIDFFTKKFATITLKNEIVASVLYIVSKRLAEFKDKLDKTLNTDI